MDKHQYDGGENQACAIDNGSTREPAGHCKVNGTDGKKE
jgi:hypothetical protein